MYTPFSNEENVNIQTSILKMQTPLNNQINPQINEMLNLLNNCQYVKLEFPELCFIILNTFNLYTLSSIKDESSTESHKTFLFQAKMKPIKCICDEISIECKTGLTPETANDYFCKYFIKSKTFCNDQILYPMTLEIAPSIFEENESNYEISYGSIERIQQYYNNYCIRKFYGYKQNDYKYYIGDINYNCKCNLCDFCYFPFKKFFCCCTNKKRFLYKLIFNRNNEECGEYNYILENSCCCQKTSFEIRFPHDADVPMKLLLIGGLIDSILFFYISKPELNKPNIKIIPPQIKNKLVILFTCFFIYVIIILFLIFMLITKRI
jgi:hypothetical protein